MNIQDAISACNAAWTAHARPIVEAYVLMDQAFMPLFKAAVADPTHRKRYGERTMQVRDWDEATKIVDKARDALYDMLDGIRDNHRCDYCQSFPDGISDEEWDRREEWNAELEAGLITVEAFVREVERAND